MGQAGSRKMTVDGLEVSQGKEQLAAVCYRVWAVELEEYPCLA